MGLRHGPGQEPKLVSTVRRDAELSRLRCRHVGQRGVPLALRPDVLPRAPQRQPGQGADRRPGRCTGRIAEPPVVHRRHRGAHAASAHASRHHPVVPVPQHVRLPHLRAVRRAAADHRPTSGIADRAASPRVVRLRGRPQRRAIGHCRRAGGEGVDGPLGGSPRRHCRPRQPASRRCFGDLAEPAHGRRAAPRGRRQRRGCLGDHRQLQRGDQPRAPMDHRRAVVATDRPGWRAGHHAVHVFQRPDPVPRLSLWRRLAARPRVDIVEPA